MEAGQAVRDVSAMPTMNSEGLALRQMSLPWAAVLA